MADVQPPPVILRLGLRLGLVVAGIMAAALSPALLLVLSHLDGTAGLPADCAVVFGARVSGDEPGPGIRRRVATAAALHREGAVRRLVLTGGRSPEMRRSEAEVMRDLALTLGVPAPDLMIEPRAANTRENLRFARLLLDDCGGVVGVSDAYHLARIEFLARKEGWSIPTVPARERASLPFMLRSIAREVAAILYYSVPGL